MFVAITSLTACTGSSVGGTGSSTTISTPPSATPASTSTTVLAAQAACETAYFGVAFILIDDSDDSICTRVGTHFRIGIHNDRPEPLDIIWDGEPILIDGAFQPVGVVGDYLGIGVHEIQSPHVSITIEVVDAATSRYVAEPMYLRSWADLRPGQSIAEAQAAGAVIYVPPNENDIVDSQFCTYGFIEGDPYSPGIMILDGADIARLDATAPEHSTASGIRMGATTEQVLSTYENQIERTPHEYSDGEYLVFRPVDAVDRSYALVFETDDDGVVGTFRTGLAGPVRWVEGCL